MEAGLSDGPAAEGEQRTEPVDHALAGGEPQRVGWFQFHFADERWEWSPQVERMHGFEPGTATPTTSSWSATAWSTRAVSSSVPTASTSTSPRRSPRPGRSR